LVLALVYFSVTRSAQALDRRFHGANKKPTRLKKSYEEIVISYCDDGVFNRVRTL